MRDEGSVINEKKSPEKCLIVFLSSQCMRNASPMPCKCFFFNKAEFGHFLGAVGEFHALRLCKQPHKITFSISLELDGLG